VKLQLAAVVTFLAGCASGGGISADSKEATQSSASSITSLFKRGETIAFRIKSEDGKLLGRSHSVFQKSKSGLYKIRTRMLVQGEATEFALSFTAKKSPVRYKRLSSKNGKLELDFRGQKITVFADDQSREIAMKKPTSLPLGTGDIMALNFALHGMDLKPGASLPLSVFDVDKLRTRQWTVNAYLNAQQHTVVSFRNGTASLDANGRIRNYVSSEGWTFEPEIPPQAPPAVTYRARLKYREPESPSWKDRPISIGARKGVLSIPENLSRWPGLRAPLVVVLSDAAQQDRYGLSEKIDSGTWEIQNHLLEQGYAMLRIDDALELETPASITALLKFMSMQSGVDAERLVILGHGQGGWSALRAGLESPELVSAVGLLATGFKKMPPDLKNALTSTKFPVGVYQGLKDFEVSWKEETQALVKLLERRPIGKKALKAIYYSRVDHLMKQEPKTSAAGRYEDRSRRIEPKFLADLSKWLDNSVFAAAQN